MNRKSLYIAMALTLPAFLVIGCGSNSPKIVSEEKVATDTIEMNEAQYQLEQYQQPEDVISDVKETEVTNEIVEPVLAEVEQTEKTNEVATVSVEPEMSKPNEMAFYFDTNKTDVKQDDYEKIISHAEYLLKNPDMKLKLIGHTDQSGDAEYNKQLAMKRSKSVAQILIDYGVQPGQIITESLGEEFPISSFEHAIYDRRVELEYTQETRLTER